MRIEKKIYHRAFLISAFLLCFWGGPSLSADAEEPSRGEIAHWRFLWKMEERLRYEYRQNFDFNEQKPDNGGLFFHRLKLGLSVSLKDKDLRDVVEIYLEGLDAQVGAYQIDPIKTQTDDFDLHQAFIVVHDIGGSTFDVKAGRMELKYGKGRLIGPPPWPNRIRAFDGAVLHSAQKGFYGDLLYGQDMKYDDNSFNSSSKGEFITGFYGGYQKQRIAPLFEGYILKQSVTPTATKTRRYTISGRFQEKIFGNADLEVESSYQFGKTGTTDIRAYALNAALSGGFDSLVWSPGVNFEYNYASGDKDPSDNESNTFIPLYQAAHDPYGLLDFLRWQNMQEASLSVNLSPSAKLKLIPQTNFFWLASTSDSWYDSSGTKLRTKTSGQRSHYLGQEISLRAAFDILKKTKWEAGWAHFFTGAFVRDTGSSDDTDWVYSQLTYRIH